MNRVNKESAVKVIIDLARWRKADGIIWRIYRKIEKSVWFDEGDRFENINNPKPIAHKRAVACTWPFCCHLKCVTPSSEILFDCHPLFSIPLRIIPPPHHAAITNMLGDKTVSLTQREGWYFNSRFTFVFYKHYLLVTFLLVSIIKETTNFSPLLCPFPLVYIY